MRRLHDGAGAARGRAALLPAGQRLHPAARPGRRRRNHHGRGSRRGRKAASRAAGDGRSARLAMRLLHARHRDEPVRALPRWGVPRRATASTSALAGNLCRCTGYRPIVDAALSVIDGAPRTSSAARGGAARGARRARRRPRSVRRRRDELLRRARERGRARRLCMAAIPTRCCSAARPTSASGSPSV